MKTDSLLPRILALAAVGALNPSSYLLAQGGSLTPPGPPAPTMKTLDQVEARTPISSAPFNISTSGSYYLTKNLAVTTGNGVNIAADEVTLDLNGFAISSTASPAIGSGVLISGTRKNVTVKNGHIRGTTTFAAGVFTAGGFANGISSTAVASGNLLFVDVSVSGVGSDGIHTIFSSSAPRDVAERCTVSICGDVGIRVATVRDCRADTVGDIAIVGDIVVNSFGQSVGTAPSNHGISGFFVVENCRGLADVGNGVQGGAQVSNSIGTSVSGKGLVANCASNCQGVSTSGTGIIATTALNCVGESDSGSNGINASIVSFSSGKRDGGVAISATNAIGCTVTGTGTVTATNKSLGTP